MPTYRCPQHPGRSISEKRAFGPAEVARKCVRVHGAPYANNASPAEVRERARAVKFQGTARGEGIIEGITGAIGGFIRGGPIGAIEGGARGLFGGGQPSRPQPQPLQSVNCPDGSYRIPGTNRCVAPGDMFPGGDPGIIQAGGGAVEGSFGLPAIVPDTEQRTRLSCPTGMVLGKDDLCYPRQILSRRSKFRKWRPSPRPPVSAADARALRKVDSIRGKLKDLGKKADLKVTKK